jgi:hypothetical protein
LTADAGERDKFDVMQRLLSFSLFLAITFPVLAPLLVVDASGDSKLPACCRHQGPNHHCSMLLAYVLAHMPGTHIAPIPHPCNQFPAAVSPSVQMGMNCKAAEQIAVGLTSHPAIQLQVEARARISLDRAWRKRGPPSTNLA